MAGPPCGKFTPDGVTPGMCACGFTKLAHAAATSPEMAASSSLEAELRTKKLGGLSRHAVEQTGLSAAALEDAQNADEPAEALIRLIVDAESLRERLEALGGLGALSRRALEAGIDEDALSAAQDAEQPKTAVVKLLVRGGPEVCRRVLDWSAPGVAGVGGASTPGYYTGYVAAHADVSSPDTQVAQSGAYAADAGITPSPVSPLAAVPPAAVSSVSIADIVEVARKRARDEEAARDIALLVAKKVPRDQPPNTEVQHQPIVPEMQHQPVVPKIQRSGGSLGYQALIERLQAVVQDHMPSSDEITNLFQRDELRALFKGNGISYHRHGDRLSNQMKSKVEMAEHLLELLSSGTFRPEGWRGVVVIGQMGHGGNSGDDGDARKSPVSPEATPNQGVAPPAQVPGLIMYDCV